MPRKLRTVFFGTSTFAVPILRALDLETDVALVVTQPDRPRGRGLKIESPPVKLAAEHLERKIIQPEVVKGRRFAASLASIEPDFLVTAAFGRKFGRSLIDLPRIDCLNVHASLLPRHRGPAPVNWAILSGDKETGVSIMRMEEAIDTGPVYLTRSLEINTEETAGELSERLAELGAKALVETMRRFGDLEPVEQEHGQATEAPMLGKKDGEMDWRLSAVELHNHVRGLHPWPCSSTSLQGKPLKVHKSRVLLERGEEGLPGAVVAMSKDGVDVACGGGGVLRIIELQRSSRRRISAAEFIAGTRIETGSMLG